MKPWLVPSLVLAGVLFVRAQAEVASVRIGVPPRKFADAAEAGKPAGKSVAYVARIAQAPVIDGHLSEEVWRKSDVLAIGRTLDGSGAASQPTEVRLLRDERMLYIGVRAREPFPGKMQAAVREHDGALWGDDSIEMFIGATPEWCYHLIVNALGTTYDGSGGDGTWESGVKAAAAVGKGEWTAELAIPIANLLPPKTVDKSLPGADGKIPVKWIANFNRNRHAAGRLEEFAWSPTFSPSSHVPERFGELLFADPPPERLKRFADKAAPAGVTLLPCESGEGIVRFDLAAVPSGARIRRADLRAFRSAEITGQDEEMLANIEIFPLFAETGAGGAPSISGEPLPLRGPWSDVFDATEAVRTWIGGKTNGGFFVKIFPFWDREATCLEILYDGAPSSGVPAPVAGLRAFHRGGQTFLTWREIEDPVGRDEIPWRDLRLILANLDRERDVRYQVFRHTRPITAETVGDAELLASVKPLSCWNVNGRNMEKPIDDRLAHQYALIHGHWNPFVNASVDGEFGLECGMERLAIEDGGQPLPRGTGLYVNTVRDEKSRAYYAVVTAVNGVLNTRDFSPANSLAEAVEESPAVSLPVLQRELPRRPFWNYREKRFHYVRWATPSDSNLPGQYFNWAVCVPEPLAEKAPLELVLPADGRSYYATPYRIRRDSIVAIPYDFPLKTYWHGFHEAQGTLKSFKQGAIHPYTESRILSFLEWICGRWPVDKSRVLVTGLDGGAALGARHLGGRNPRIFTQVLPRGSAPGSLASAGRGKNDRFQNMREDLERLWGRLEWKLPTDTGKSIWEEVDLKAGP